MEKVQEMFDALVAEFGAEAVVQAVKSHSIKPLVEGRILYNYDDIF